jgi:hypothetical protein
MITPQQYIGIVNNIAIQGFPDSRRSLPATFAPRPQYQMKSAEYSEPKNPFDLL